MKGKMRAKVENWTIKKLIKLKDKINEQPEYQRGDVWKPSKKKLLIDSILRGIDIPKFYLRKLNENAFDFEVADGQQRINAIYLFYDNKLRLETKVDKGLDLSRIGNIRIGGKKFEDLNPEKKKYFLMYKITVAIVDGAKDEEIRTLFGRLQLGTNLNPAEKRNAIISNIGNHINNFALNHKFFNHSRISKLRYKHQDYMAHAMALIEYANKKDLKAKLLYSLYLDESIVMDSLKMEKIDHVLDRMYEINKVSNVKIINKFAFIDIFWILYLKSNNRDEFNISGFAKEFDSFEKLRLKSKSDPKALINKKNPTKREKLLYDYIMAFDYGGALKENIRTRNKVMKIFFNKFLVN